VDVGMRRDAILTEFTRGNPESRLRSQRGLGAAAAVSAPASLGPRSPPAPDRHHVGKLPTHAAVVGLAVHVDDVRYRVERLLHVSEGEALVEGDAVETRGTIKNHRKNKGPGIEQ